MGQHVLALSKDTKLTRCELNYWPIAGVRQPEQPSIARSMRIRMTEACAATVAEKLLRCGFVYKAQAVVLVLECFNCQNSFAFLRL